MRPPSEEPRGSFLDAFPALDPVVPEGWGDAYSASAVDAPPAPADESEFFERELVFDRKTGRPRQAGATDPEGQQVLAWRSLFERSLYHFAKGVLGRRRLTRSLHYPLCTWLTSFPPKRKLCLKPRDHYKTTIISQSLPIHIFIQPKGGNVYFSDRPGVDVKVLLGCESEKMAMKRLRWIKRQFESNSRLRGLWPHVCWPRPSRDSDKWTEKEILLPRNDDSADQSLEASGVGSTVTGGHFDVLLKDDICTAGAANSHAIMEESIDWHTWSRALTDDPDEFLEFTAGTDWALHSLYTEMRRDPTVDVMVRSIVEPWCLLCDRFFRQDATESHDRSHPTELRCIMPRDEENPKGFTLEKVEELRREFGIMFNLLYMNNPSSSDLTDFVLDEVRAFEFLGDRIEFEADERDRGLTQRYDPERVAEEPQKYRGRALNRETLEALYKEHGHGREAYLRIRYA